MALNDFDYIRFTFADIVGYPRGKTITRSYANKAMQIGLGMAAGKLQFFIYKMIYFYLQVTYILGIFFIYSWSQNLT